MVLKRALADRVVLAAAFFVVLFGAMLVAAIPIYVNAVGQSGLRERLERAPVTEANLEATAPVSGGDPAALDSQVTKLTQEALAPVGGAAVYRSGESEPFNAAGRVVVFGFFDGIRDHAGLVAGRWPRDGEVVVQAPAAAALGLHVATPSTRRAGSPAAHTCWRASPGSTGSSTRRRRTGGRSRSRRPARTRASAGRS